MHAWPLFVDKDGDWLTAVNHAECTEAPPTAFSSPQPPPILVTSHHQQFLVYPSRNICDREFLDHTVSRALLHGFLPHLNGSWQLFKYQLR